MNIDPTNHLTNATSLAFLANVAEACPAFGEWHPTQVLGAAATAANMAYSGAREEVWQYGEFLEIPKPEWTEFLRLTLTDLYPVAVATGTAAERLGRAC